jgi:hypothetical protein
LWQALLPQLPLGAVHPLQATTESEGIIQDYAHSKCVNLKSAYYLRAFI